MGAGSWLALSCHMTYAAESAVFAQPEVRMISNTDVIWPVLAGNKDALRYSLTGDHIDAGEALRVGLVNEVMERGGLREFIQTRDGPFRPERFGPYSKE